MEVKMPLRIFMQIFTLLILLQIVNISCLRGNSNSTNSHINTSFENEKVNDNGSENDPPDSDPYWEEILHREYIEFVQKNKVKIEWRLN